MTDNAIVDYVAPLMRICHCGSHIDPDTYDDAGRIWCETCGDYYDRETGRLLPHPDDDIDALDPPAGTRED